MKKKYIAFLCSTNNLNEVLGPHETLFKKLGNSFEKFYIINFIHLKFFSDESGIKGKFNADINTNIKKPKNLEIFTPKSLYEIKNFMIDKRIIGIQNLSRNLSDLLIHFAIAKFKISQIMISNFGFFNTKFKTSLDDKISKPFANLFYFLNKTLGQKIILFLANLRILNKIDIRFTSDKGMIARINKNIFKKVLYKLRIFYSKEIILINSKNYDNFNEKTFENSQKKIVLLDAFLEHPDGSSITKKISDEDKTKHYKNLNIFLEKISSYYKKNITICIHPKDNLENKKKIFNNYDVVQFQTQKNIYQAFIVLYFDTSAIVDAILLKKKIIFINSKYIPNSWLEMGKSYADKSNIININIEDNLENIISSLSEKLEKQTQRYDNYINNYIKVDGERNGLEVVINTIKKRFFEIF